MKVINIYLLCFLISFFISLFIVPLVRKISMKLGNYDVPNEIKTHTGKVPLSGGIAVFFSFTLTLLLLRFLTSFPTGTLRELRYILTGAGLFLVLGLIDDFKKPEGIKAEYKFVIEIFIAFFMLFRGFEIKFIQVEKELDFKFFEIDHKIFEKINVKSKENIEKNIVEEKSEKSYRRKIKKKSTEDIN
jgi:UDP-N-acetylmuramyl pentapeptide phosphotransferase/UDP-N-acetylglucosamine-1-phosphate transferase